MVVCDMSCFIGYCCVYDEFFCIIYYCKKLGVINEFCLMVVSDVDCLCEFGFMCVFIVQGLFFVIIYGRCKLVGMMMEEVGMMEVEYINYGYYVIKYGQRVVIYMYICVYVLFKICFDM